MPVSRPRALCATLMLSTGVGGSAKRAEPPTYLLFHLSECVCYTPVCCFQAIEINTARQRSTIETDAVVARGFCLIEQGLYELSSRVIDSKFHR